MNEAVVPSDATFCKELIILILETSGSSSISIYKNFVYCLHKKEVISLCVNVMYVCLCVIMSRLAKSILMKNAEKVKVHNALHNYIEVGFFFNFI